MAAQSPDCYSKLKVPSPDQIFIFRGYSWLLKTQNHDQIFFFLGGGEVFVLSYSKLKVPTIGQNFISFYFGGEGGIIPTKNSNSQVLTKFSFSCVQD